MCAVVIPISYSEIHNGVKPSNQQFSELLSSFKTEPTFISLAMWNLMLSLFEKDVEKYKYLQGFFIHNLIPKNLRDRVSRAAALDSESPRAVFGRWQLLAVMKKVLLETSNAGDRDPRHDDDARRILGEACLMQNDLLFTEEQEERLRRGEGPGESERIHDELMTQWLFQYELHHPPDVYQAVARNDEYFKIFEHRSRKLTFDNNQTLVQRFTELTGLSIQQYLRLYFAIYALHTTTLETRQPEEINANPSLINFDKERVFALMELNPEELGIFFKRILVGLPAIVAGVKQDANSTRAWQFDFTTFRNSPLVFNSDSKRGFTCIAFPFLIEKLASGIYHTILNSWEEGDPERKRFQSYWGKVFEHFVNDRLRDQYPSKILSKQFYANPYFVKKKNRSIEVSDAVLDHGDSLVLMEHKGGYLSLDEKYGDNAAELLKGIAVKFGKAIKQLSRGIGMLLNEDDRQRDDFSEYDEKRRAVSVFGSADVARIRKVYPVVVVQDFSMTMGFMNRRMKLQFSEEMRKYKVRANVHIRPLCLLSIENVEDVFAQLEEVKLIDVLDEYAREVHDPLSNFNAIFTNYLKTRGIERRRYSWSRKRGEEFLDSIMKQFTIDG